MAFYLFQRIFTGQEQPAVFFCIYIVQWRIQEFRNLGAWSRRGRILRHGVCFEAPSHIPYVFVLRVNKIHIVNVVCWLKSKYMRVIQSKFKIYKNNPPIFFQTGGRPWRAGPGSAFVVQDNFTGAALTVCLCLFYRKGYLGILSQDSLSVKIYDILHLPQTGEI